MLVLVVNCGSSSLKVALVDRSTGRRLMAARVERIGEESPTRVIAGGTTEPCSAPDHTGALASVLPLALESLPEGRSLDGVGHRVVHGGERFAHPTRIDVEVEAAIEELSALAPLHNPANLAGIRAARALLPDIPHVAVFDTAFHATLPRRARAYAIPAELAREHGIRRYGFHGTSHAFVARRAAEHLGEDLRDLRIITCHLGGGCSIAAVEYGRSTETSMGMTPLEGLVMGTRSGDLDPGAIFALMRAENLDVDAADELLNRRSGLAGLSGVGRDLRDIEAGAAEGNDDCRMAIHVFCHRLRKYIGAYSAAMGGVDAIVFTAGIGENSAATRHRAAQRLEFLGARLDEDRNREASVDDASPVAEISAEHSRVRLLVVRTDEELAIAQATGRLVAEDDRVAAPETIPVAISGRHVHLDAPTLTALFGEGYELTVRKPLSQPGQFAAEETVGVIGPKGSFDRVRILGPLRSRNQIEVSTTDEFRLGLDAPVRASGKVANSPGVTLVGPAGRIELSEGIICAWRHLHMTPEDAAAFGVADRDVVDVRIDTDGRDLVFGDVLVRVSPKYRLEMHIDTDEANAAGISGSTQGVLFDTEGCARITARHR